MNTTPRTLVLLCFSFIYYGWALKPNDDFSLLRQQVLEVMLWPAPENITVTIQNALHWAETLNSSCYWPDVIYNDTRLAEWRTLEHLYRISTMLQALTVNGSTVSNDSHLRTASLCALDVWLVNDWQSLNWVNNEVHAPIWTGSHLLMLGNNVTDFERKKIIEISFRASWWIPTDRTVGTNLLWMLQAQIYRSLATNNLTGVDQAFTRMWQDVALQPSDSVGLQFDWTYHFHGTQLLNGDYGKSWGMNILGFTLSAQQTKYELSNDKLLLFGQYLTRSCAWMIIGKNWDFSSIGRAVSRPTKEYFVLFSTKSIRQLIPLIPSNTTQIELNNLADRLDGFSNASVLVGNQHFFASDYHVHRRKHWSATIKMQSNRTQPIECLNDEDQKGEHSGQGVLNLYIGTEYAYDDIFPLLDWQALNGITVEHDIPLEQCVRGAFSWIRLSFVGGVSDNQYGLAMMDTASHNLTAKRSWHFYDDAIIALATHLAVKTPTTPWTTLASRLFSTGQITLGFFNSTMITLNDGNYTFPYSEEQHQSNVQWIHVGQSNILYVLQNQQQYASLGIDFGMKTGNYLSIGPFNQTITARVLTIWINHGRGPFTSMHYNYMIVPTVSLTNVSTLIEQYQQEQVFSCQSSNGHFHGTMWPRLKRASFVLWEKNSTTFSCQSTQFQINIQIYEPGSYLYSETDQDFTLTVSHPTNLGTTVKVTIDRIGSGEGCKSFWNDVNPSTDVTLSLPSSKDYMGASVNVTCHKQ